MKVSQSVCDAHEDTDIIYGSVRHFGWHSCSTPLYHKLSTALIFLHTSLSHALIQHSVTRTKNFLPHALPAPSSTHARHAPARITQRFNPPRAGLYQPYAHSCDASFSKESSFSRMCFFSFGFLIRKA